jgi:hypothetical protein|tara:strand:+ start:76 stop:534 length:459 start_codon:yes stop_codon:yes gene_type:complete
MITLLGSLLGFGTSFLPEVLNFFRAGQDHKHKLESMQLEMELMTKRSELQLNIMDKQAEIKETEGLYKHDSMDAGGFINALRGSVRPVITYVFFGLFIAIKITAIVALMNSGNDLGRSLSLIWDDQTAGLFAAIMSFWFGGRAISKYMKVKT